MEILYAFLFVVIIFGSLGILYVYQFNKLQHSKTKIDQAEYLIDEALRNKYDLLTRVDTFLQKELKSSKTFFTDLEKIKDEDISNFDLDRKIKEYINTWMQIKVDYADLANSKGFKELLNENKKLDEKLQSAKMYYNKYTGEMNDLIRSFPSNIVARMHGIEIKTFFDGKNMEDEIIDDFKL